MQSDFIPLHARTVHANAAAPHYREGVGVLGLSVQRLEQRQVPPDPRGGHREHIRVEVQGQLELRVPGLQRNTHDSDGFTLLRQLSSSLSLTSIIARLQIIFN